MFELTINGEVYEFNFGMGFMREMDKKVSVPMPNVKGVSKNVGLSYSIGSIMDGDLDELINALVTANKGKEPRLTVAEMDKHIEKPDTDIDKLFEDVLGFFESSNATKKTLQSVKSEIAKQTKEIS